MNIKMRIAAVTVSIVLAGTVLVGCGGNEPIKYKGDPNVGKMGKYKETIQLDTAMSYFISSSLPKGETETNNMWTRLYKEKLGIDVKYRFAAPNNQYIEKLNIYIGSGDIPDAFTVDLNQLGKLIKANLIHEDLAPIFEKYATDDTKRISGGITSNGFKKATVNGKLRGIPWNESNSDTAEIMFIRKDWLEKLKLPVPKTIDDLEKVLYAFVNNDPDGNGQKDTIGLVGNKELFKSSCSFAGIFYAYGAYPDIWVEGSPGKLNYGFFAEEMKPALKKLNDWYKKGLINEEFAVKDSGKAAGMVMSSKCGVYFGNMASPLWPIQTTVANNFNADWLVLPVPTATDKPAKTALNDMVWRFHVVSKKCKNPEAVILIQNAFVDKLWGKDNEFMKYHTAHSFALFQTWPSTKNLDAYKAVRDAVDKKSLSALNSEQKKYYDNVMTYLNNGKKITKSSQSEDWGHFKIFYTGGTQNVIDDYLKNNLYVNEKFTGLDTKTMVLKRKTVESAMKEAITKIIMGDLSVDSFDRVIQNVRKNGADQITQEVNDWYKAQH